MTDLPPAPRACPEGPRPRGAQPPRRDHLRGRPAGRDRGLAVLLEDRVHVHRGRRRGGRRLGAAQGLPGQGHRPARAADHARRRRDGGRRLLLRRSGAGHRHRRHRPGDHAVAAATRRRRLRAERHGIGVHADLRAVPRLVRRAAAGRGRRDRLRPLGRRRQGHRHVHRRHHRLRHRRLLRRRPVRPAPDGAGDLARRSRGRASSARSSSASSPAGRWSPTSSRATGGSASCSA